MKLTAVQRHADFMVFSLSEVSLPMLLHRKPVECPGDVAVKRDIGRLDGKSARRPAAWPWQAFFCGWGMPEGMPNVTWLIVINEGLPGLVTINPLPSLCRAAFSFILCVRGCMRTPPKSMETQ